MKVVLLISSVLFLIVCEINGQIAGGLTDLNPSDYTKVAWKAVPQINSKNNGPNYLIPIKVVKAQIQVVAGTNTVLQVLVGESTCSKKGSIDVSKITSANCQLKSGGKRSLYKVSIWEKVWEKFEQITAEKIRDVAANEKF